MSHASSPSAIPDRRHDLDWLRIAAFGLLILYHIGMFYVTWDWHVKSSRASGVIEPLMQLSNPWRLLLLFVISGAATRFMLDRMKPGPFMGSRVMRLLVPLLFTVFVIVPPQTYFEIVEKLGYAGSFADFYPAYATASGDWRPGGQYLITPTWNHMWFVVYILVYSLLIPLVAPLLRAIPARIAAPLVSPLPLILLPFAFLFIMRMTLMPMFGQTHALIDDAYVHAVSFAGFLFGYAVAKHAPFFHTCVRLRWIALGLTLTAWLIRMLFGDLIEAALPEGPDLAVLRALRELQAWTAILAAIGFAHRHLATRDGPVRRYLTDAIFPFYIIHQTVIVIAGHYLDPLQLPILLEAAILIAVTLLACWLGFEIAHRVAFLRPLFGLKLTPVALPLRRPPEAGASRGA